MSRLGFSIVRGPLDEDVGEPVEGALSGEGLSIFFSSGFSYDRLQVSILIVFDDIIRISSVELEFP